MENTQTDHIYNRSTGTTITTADFWSSPKRISVNEVGETIYRNGIQAV